MSQETTTHSSETGFEQPSFIDHILKIFPGIINIYDLVDQRSVYTNHNILELLGYSPEQIKNLGVSTIDFMLHPEDVTKVPQIITQLTQTNEGEMLEFEFRARHASGEWRWLNSRNTVITRTAENYPKQIFSLIEDVTVRKILDDELRENVLKYHTLFETSTDAIYLETLEGRILDCNDTACQMLGYSKDELTTLTVADLVPESIAQMLPKLIEEEQTTGGAFVEALNRRKNGEIFPCEVSTRLITLNGQPRILAYVRDITERKKAEEERKRRETERMVLLEIMQGAAATKDVHEFIRLIHNAIAKVIYAENFFVIFYNKHIGLFEEVYTVDQYDAPAPPSKLEKSITSYVFHTSEPLLINKNEFEELVAQGLMALVGTNSACWLGAPIKTPQETIGVIAVQHYEDPNCYTARDKDFLASIGAQVSLALERKMAEENLQASEKRYRAVVENSPFGMLFYELKPDGSLVFIGANPSADRILGTPNEQFIGKTIEEAFPGLIYTEVPDHYRSVAREGGVWQIDQVDYNEGNIRGVFAVTAFQTAPSFIAVMFTDITEQKQATERIQRQMKNLAALNTIDRAIASSLDLQITLNIVISHVINQLGVDAAVIFLFNKSINSLEFYCYHGFRNNLTLLNLWNRDALVWQAILKNQLVSSANLMPVDQIPGEDFKFSFAAPLVAKGEIKGVLQIYHRARLITDEDWRNMLHTLAEQTAIAIDNAQLFDNLQRTNAELSQAYSATLEGWSAALDLRDKETEGHSQRVMEMTIKIAQILGVKDKELVDIRRGALLHDMGKIGIPDAILQNPGPLSDEEWAIMRKHPEYAYQLLYPIIHLRSSLDIPYCHHEKWDGTGYPRGLKGEEIPLAARIFAVVDVWDALLSDRPYRAAWSRKEALDYIRAQAGAHFDPQVVDIFLRLVGDG